MIDRPLAVVRPDMSRFYPKRWRSAEYFELRIESGIVVHADGQFPKADEIIHPHSGIKEAEER